MKSTSMKRFHDFAKAMFLLIFFLETKRCRMNVSIVDPKQSSLFG